MKRVTVVGAGVIGLAVAWKVKRAGHDVRVLSDQPGEKSTSGVAGAMWYPFKIGRDPDDRTFLWAKETYRELVELAARPETGVLGTLPAYLLADADSPRPKWEATALPTGPTLTWEATESLPDWIRGYAASLDRRTPGAWRFPAPVLDPHRHLGWLRAELGESVDTTPCVVESFDALEADVVVDCTGRRARALTDDEQLKPAFGQVVVTTDARFPRDAVLADDRDETRLTYLIPRGREVVLGGCNLEHDPTDESWNRAPSPSPVPELTERILERFAAAGLPRPTNYRAVAEWRPVHEWRVILRRAGKVIHNYGHGGAGFTLMYGCARSVVDEIRRM